MTKEPLAQRQALPLALAIALATSAFSASAAAQDLGRPEGIGLKIGDGRLHVSTQLEAHYLTNPGYVSSDTVERGIVVQPAGDVMLLLRPGFDYLRPSSRLELKLAGDIDRHQYLGIQNSDTKSFSGTSGHASVGALINKESWLTFMLHDALTRDDEPANQTLYERLVHTSNETGLGVQMAPGGGALRLTINYDFVIDRYSNVGVLSPGDLSYTQHRPHLSASWKFLPKTAAFFEARGTITNYDNGSASPATTLTEAYFGLTGSITPKLTALLKAGYGYDFGAGAFNSVLGQAELTYAVGPTSKLKLGLVRAVQPTSIFSYFSMMRAYGRFDFALGSRTVATVGGEYSRLSFGPPSPSAAAVLGTAARTDGHALADLGVAYRINDWLVAAVRERFDMRISDYQQTNGGVDYRANDLMLRLEGRY